MAQIDQMTAPLVLRLPDGSEKVVAHCFPHAYGLLYLDLFWHKSTPEQSAHLLRGELHGEGPWKIGDAVIRVLGCHNTDPHLQPQYAPWKEYLEHSGNEYPALPQIREIAHKLGALPSQETN